MVAIWWILLSLAAASDSVEGVWDYLSYAPNEGDEIALADQFLASNSKCQAFKVVLQIEADQAYIVAETVCPVPATPLDQDNTVAHRCIAATKLPLTRDGLELSGHAKTNVNAELHRIHIEVTPEGAGTKTSRKAVSRSCSAISQSDGFMGTLVPQDDGTLQLKGLGGTLFFERTALRKHPL